MIIPEPSPNTWPRFTHPNPNLTHPNNLTPTTPATITSDAHHITLPLIFVPSTERGQIFERRDEYCSIYWTICGPSLLFALDGKPAWPTQALGSPSVVTLKPRKSHGSHRESTYPAAIVAIGLGTYPLRNRVSFGNRTDMPLCPAKRILTISVEHIGTSTASKLQRCSRNPRRCR